MSLFVRSKSDTSQSDAQLLSRFQQSGQAEDLTPLFERYLELTYSWCLRYLGTSARAEDATMELFELLLRKLPDQQISNYRSWLQTTVRNHCLMQLRREKRDVLQNSEALDVHLYDSAHPVEETTLLDPRLEGLSDCIQTLKAQQKQCIELFYLTEGTSYLSIARQLGMKLGQVRSHIQNGRRNLRQCIEAKTAKSSHRE